LAFHRVIRASSIRHSNYTAIGDTANMASRLLDIAQPGQIAVSRSTQHLTEGYFVFGDLGTFTVKGKAEPMPVWVVTGEVRGRTRLDVSLERGLTPLVGRDADLTRLLERYRRVSESSDAAIALVNGEPGVGKSRLLYEFLRRSKRSADATWRRRVSRTGARCRITRSSNCCGVPSM
jgi:hypothetical protein